MPFAWNQVGNAFNAPKSGGGLGDYQNRLIAAAIGLLQGDDWKEQVGGGLGGFLKGGQLDEANRTKLEQKRVLDEAMASPELGIPGPLRGVLSAYPEAGVGVIADRMKPPDAPEWSKLTDNRLFNQSTGETREVEGAPSQTDPASFANITTMRKDYADEPGVSRYKQTQPILASMISSVDDTSAMSDLDFVYGMAQIYDPDSVVRESEMGFVIESQSVPEGIKRKLEKALAGTGQLGRQARIDLVEASGRRVGEYRNQASSEGEMFTGIAGRHNIDPRDIMNPLAPLPVWQGEDGSTLTPTEQPNEFNWNPQ